MKTPAAIAPEDPRCPFCRQEGAAGCALGTLPSAGARTICHSDDHDRCPLFLSALLSRSRKSGVAGMLHWASK